MRLRLTELREAAGFRSAKAFAEHIGLNPRTYSSYEEGTRSPGLDVAFKLSRHIETVALLTRMEGE